MSTTSNNINEGKDKYALVQPQDPEEQQSPKAEAHGLYREAPSMVVRTAPSTLAPRLEARCATDLVIADEDEEYHRAQQDAPASTTRYSVAGIAGSERNMHKNKPVSVVAAVRLARDPPTINRYSTINTVRNPIRSKQVDMERRLAALEVENDLEPPAGFSRDVHVGFEPVQTFDSAHEAMNQPEWTKRESSLSFMSGRSSGLGFASNKADEASTYSDIQSWIRTSPSFPPRTPSQAEIEETLMSRNIHDRAQTMKSNHFVESKANRERDLERESAAADNLCTIPLGMQDVLSSANKKINKWSLAGFRDSLSPLSTEQKVGLSQPPPSLRDKENFNDEHTQTTGEEQPNRSRKWDKIVFAAFFLTSLVIGIAIGIKLWIGQNNSNNETNWVRITEAPAKNDDVGTFGTEDLNSSSYISTTLQDDNGGVPSGYQFDTTDSSFTEEIEQQQQQQQQTNYEVPKASAIDYVLRLPDYTRFAIENDDNSPQAKAYRWFESDPDYPSYPEWRQLQRFALVTFFYSSHGHEWLLSENWLLYGTPECHWYTYADFENIQRCDSDGTFSSLMLGHNDLQGKIPLEIGLLTKLRYLDFRSNQLHGPLPTTLGGLTELVSINIGINSLTGEIPPALGNLTELVQLDFSNNNLTQWLPTEVGRLTNLQKMTLDENALEGLLPSELGLLTALTTLSGENNTFSSTIPGASLSKLTDLNVLRLGSNQVRHGFSFYVS